MDTSLKWNTKNETSDKVRHERLVDTIRGVHERLRRACQLGLEADVVWSEHVKEKPRREAYAQAMKELATNFWTDSENSRITWCRSVWRWYFKEDGLCRWVKKFKLLYPGIVFDSGLIRELLNLEKIKVLDVGSCYNPFRSFPECECLGLDLTPASECVFECDFLSVKIVDASSIPAEDTERVTLLVKESFDVVVFSLLLEYLPSSVQRWRCCALACQLLVPLGLLLIVTPDSKSQHKNAPMMKAWRESVEEIGMHRVVYKKLPHLHCMAFCKVSPQNCCPENVPSSAQKMYIPQDTNDYTQCPTNLIQEERTEQSNNEMMQQFLTLPFSDDGEDLN